MSQVCVDLHDRVRELPPGDPAVGHPGPGLAAVQGHAGPGGRPAPARQLPVLLVIRGWPRGHLLGRRLVRGQWAHAWICSRQPLSYFWKEVQLIFLNEYIQYLNQLVVMRGTHESLMSVSN